MSKGNYMYCTCKQRDAERSEYVEDSKLGNQTEQSGIDKMSEQTEWQLRNQTKLSEHVAKNQQMKDPEQSEDIKKL